jgi:dienelactone hydrolase
MLRIGEVEVCERPVELGSPSGTFFAVVARPVTMPAADATVVFFDAGVQRRIGPNRMWVELARRWAARGLPSVRVDLKGIGDADGESKWLAGEDSAYHPSFPRQVGDVLDWAATQKLPARFVLVGLCSGAYWGFQAALTDERVLGAFMLNPRMLIWRPGVNAARHARRYGRKLRQPSEWRRLLRGEAPFRLLVQTAVWLLLRVATAPAREVQARVRRGQGEASASLDRAFDTLRDRGQRAVVIFCGDEPLYEEMAREDVLTRVSRWPNVDIVSVPVPSDSADSHTLRPLWLQRKVRDLLESELERLIPPVSSAPAVVVSRDDRSIG